MLSRSDGSGVLVPYDYRTPLAACVSRSNGAARTAARFDDAGALGATDSGFGTDCPHHEDAARLPTAGRPSGARGEWYRQPRLGRADIRVRSRSSNFGFAASLEDDVSIRAILGGPKNTEQEVKAGKTGSF
jgi:hypothetical protein